MVNIFYLSEDPLMCAQLYHDQHVNKILIEIVQLVSQVYHQHKIKPERTLNKFIYQRTNSIKLNSYPYLWIVESRSNFIYCIRLAQALLKEFKYRHQKDYHAVEPKLEWINNNIPSFLPETGITPFVMTINTKIYHRFFTSPVEASLFAYVDYKILNKQGKERLWKKRGKPKIITEYHEESQKIKNENYKEIYDLLYTIDKLTRKRNDDIDITLIVDQCFDYAFGMDHKKFIKSYHKMFRPDQELLKQLGVGHLLAFTERLKLFTHSIQHNNKLPFHI